MFQKASLLFCHYVELQPWAVLYLIPSSQDSGNHGQQATQYNTHEVCQQQFNNNQKYHIGLSQLAQMTPKNIHLLRFTPYPTKI